MPMNNDQRSTTIEELVATIRDAADGYVVGPYVLDRIGVAIEREPERMAELLSRFAPEPTAMARIRESAAPREPRFTEADKEEPGNVRMASSARRETPSRSNPILEAEQRRQAATAERTARRNADDGKTFADKINDNFGVGLEDGDEPAKMVDAPPKVDGSKSEAAQSSSVGPSSSTPTAGPIVSPPEGSTDTVGQPANVPPSVQGTPDAPKTTGTNPPPGGDPKRTNTGKPNRPGK